MIRYIFKKIIAGSVTGLLAGYVIVLVTWAYAVPPGLVTNPTFGPQGDDVVGRIAWDSATCYWSLWSCQPECEEDEVKVGEQARHNDRCYDDGGTFDANDQRIQCCK